jgi:hypothetical protein
VIELEMTTSERVDVAHIVEKMVETKLRWFEHIEWRLVDFVVRTVDQMKESHHIARGRGRPIKTIKNDLKINELKKDMIFAKNTIASFDS